MSLRSSVATIEGGHVLRIPTAEAIAHSDAG
jgi:hypothetical protein